MTSLPLSVSHPIQLNLRWPDHVGLIAKVAQALDESAGALQNYQDVQIELHALEETLRHLQALKPNEHNRAHVDVIHGMALTCQIPLQNFTQKISKFEQSMSAFLKHGNNLLKAFGRNLQSWGLPSESRC